MATHSLLDPDDRRIYRCLSFRCDFLILLSPYSFEGSSDREEKDYSFDRLRNHRE